MTPKYWDTAVSVLIALLAIVGSECVTGVMMPMGYEFGERAPLDPVRPRPGGWERLRNDANGVGYDLCDAVAGANDLHRSLAGAATAQVVSAPDAQVAALLRNGAAGPAGIAPPPPPPPRASASVAAKPVPSAIASTAIRGIRFRHLVM